MRQVQITKTHTWPSYLDNMSLSMTRGARKSDARLMLKLEPFQLSDKQDLVESNLLDRGLSRTLETKTFSPKLSRTRVRTVADATQSKLNPLSQVPS